MAAQGRWVFADLKSRLALRRVSYMHLEIDSDPMNSRFEARVAYRAGYVQTLIAKAKILAPVNIFLIR